MREFRKCLGCDKYFWTIEQPDARDNNAERLKYCKSCLEFRINKPTTIAELERENCELSEQEKQRQEDEEYFQKFRRYRAN